MEDILQTPHLFNIQLASEIDQFQIPSQLTTVFLVGQDIYVTFEIDSRGQNGWYVIAKWYSNQQLSTETVLRCHGNNQRGYLSTQYQAPGNGSIKLYWTREPASKEEFVANREFLVR